MQDHTFLEVRQGVISPIGGGGGAPGHPVLIWTAGGAEPVFFLWICFVLSLCVTSLVMSNGCAAWCGSSRAVAVVVHAVPSWGLDSVICTVAIAAFRFQLQLREKFILMDLFRSHLKTFYLITLNV
jgi:hypothetical protein